VSIHACHKLTKLSGWNKHLCIIFGQFERGAPSWQTDRVQLHRPKCLIMFLRTIRLNEIRCGRLRLINPSQKYIFNFLVKYLKKNI